jgi:pimeloyl-ACP methyl ester carboxylesterase
MLPGSGSDEQFINSVFAVPLAGIGVELVAPAPRCGGDVVVGYREALDAAGPGPLLVGGISLGAHVAARWAVEAPRGRVAGLLLALPAWTGAPRDAPAARAASLTAAQARAGGVAGALAAAAGAPAWLRAELARAWAGYGDGLAAALEAAAAEPAPTEAQLRGLDVPVGLAALVDDAVHPLGVAQQWHAALPRSALVTAGMSTFGADPAALGRAAALAWLRAAALPTSPGVTPGGVPNAAAPLRPPVSRTFRHGESCV